MRPLLSRIVGLSLLGAASLGSAAQIDVMTQNQYLGADLTPVLNAATADPFDPSAFSDAVVATLTKIAATHPSERARALAADIAQRKPDIVGLQESIKLECMPDPVYGPLPGMGCDDPAIKAAFTDRLEDTVAALRSKYVVAGKVTNLHLPAVPFLVNGYPAVLALSDRDAILVREDLPASWVDFAWLGAPCRPSDQGCNYWTAPPPLSTPIGMISIERGFLAVDVMVKGREYRVFNTHLEQRLLAPNMPGTRLLQVGQSIELLNFALLDLTKATLIVGDINSDPGDTIPSPPFPPNTPTPYTVFTFSGFTDSWTQRPHQENGLTCCQSEDLTNRQPALYERVDMIFSLVPPSHVLDMKLLGNTMGDKTRPPGNGGLWPSDHAALAAKLKFE